MKQKEFTVEQIAEALIRTRGNKMAAAALLDCGETTFYRFCHRHPELWHVSRLARMPHLERAESQLVELVRAGQWGAIRWVLERLGADRGYVTRRGRRSYVPGKHPKYVAQEKARIAKARAEYGDDQAVLTGRNRAKKHRRRGSAYLFTPEEVADALTQAHGMKRHAARLLGCSDTTVYRYIARYPKVAAAADLARETLLDEAEAQTMDKVDAAYWPAVKFILDTLGQERGYGNPPPTPPSSPSEPPGGYEAWRKEIEQEVRRAYDRAGDSAAGSCGGTDSA